MGNISSIDVLKKNHFTVCQRRSERFKRLLPRSFHWKSVTFCQLLILISMFPKRAGRRLRGNAYTYLRMIYLRHGTPWHRAFASRERREFSWRLTRSTWNCSRENGRAFESTLLIGPIGPPRRWLETLAIIFSQGTNYRSLPAHWTISIVLENCTHSWFAWSIEDFWISIFLDSWWYEAKNNMKRFSYFILPYLQQSEFNF